MTPFKSERQRKYLFANKPTIAKRWAKKTKPKKTAKRFSYGKHSKPKI